MLDMLEGVCRYLVLKLRQHLILSKKYFSLDRLNVRIEAFQYDHSSRPNGFTDHQLHGDKINMGAIQIFNFVLGLNLIAGDFVPEGDVG